MTVSFFVKFSPVCKNLAALLSNSPEILFLFMFCSFFFSFFFSLQALTQQRDKAEYLTRTLCLIISRKKTLVLLLCFRDHSVSVGRAAIHAHDLQSGKKRFGNFVTGKKKKLKCPNTSDESQSCDLNLSHEVKRERRARKTQHRGKLCNFEELFKMCVQRLKTTRNIPTSFYVCAGMCFQQHTITRHLLNKQSIAATLMPALVRHLSFNTLPALSL